MLVSQGVYVFILQTIFKTFKSYSPKKLRLVTNVVLLLQVSNVLCNSMKKNSLLLEPKRV